MELRRSYTVFAPFYDVALASVTAAARRTSLGFLGSVTHQAILVAGIGTGLDIPMLPKGAFYIGQDITPAMLRKAAHRAREAGLDMHLDIADVMHLPYANASFDAVVMHLIMAVVAHPEQALAEAARVLKPGGRVLIFDKFLRPGQRAPLRRLLSPLLQRVATRTDVVFEDALASCPGLTVEHDLPALAGGWFRYILLRKAV